MEEKIAVIGDHDSIIGYKMLGMEIFDVSDSSQAAQALNYAASEGYVIIYITEQIAAQIPETITTYRDKKLPAVVLIPSILGEPKIGMQQVRDSVKKAVGIDILGFDE